MSLVRVDGHKFGLDGNSTGDRGFKQGFEWPDSSFGESCSAKKLVDILRVGGELEGGLGAECCQTAADQNPLTGLHAGYQCQNGVVAG